MCFQSVGVAAAQRGEAQYAISGAYVDTIGEPSIGEIEDVLVDLDHATVTAMTLWVGGFLGIGDKLVAVPVNQIKVGSEAKFTTDLTKDQLSNDPAFDFAKLK